MQLQKRKMPFTPSDSKKVLETVFADLHKLLKSRDKNDPGSTLDAVEERLMVAHMIMNDTKKPKKKKKGGTKRKGAPTDAEVECVESVKSA